MVVGQDRLHVELTESVVVLSEYVGHGCFVILSRIEARVGTIPSAGNSDVRPTIKCFMALLPRGV